MRTREEIAKEVVQELFDYIDGDAENGPRHGVSVNQDDIAVEVNRRFMRETVMEELGITEEDNPDLVAELDALLED